MSLIGPGIDLRAVGQLTKLRLEKEEIHRSGVATNAVNSRQSALPERGEGSNLGSFVKAIDDAAGIDVILHISQL